MRKAILTVGLLALTASGQSASFSISITDYIEALPSLCHTMNVEQHQAMDSTVIDLLTLIRMGWI